MNIQPKSDLHWEGKNHKVRISIPDAELENYVHPDADVLVLPGDMINATDEQVDYLLWKFQEVKIPILLVPGNHEYWYQSFLHVREYLEKKLSGTNITLLDRKSVVLADKKGDPTVFIGATMWTSLANPMKALVAKQCRDFSAIKDLTVNYWHNRHVDDMDFIEKELMKSEYDDMNKVVLTHYLPSHQSVPERFKSDLGNCIFVSEDAERLIDEYQPDLWIHGHTHDSNDYKRGKSRVISNPKGRWYSDFNGLNASYKNDLIITI